MPTVIAFLVLAAVAAVVFAVARRARRRLASPVALDLDPVSPTWLAQVRTHDEAQR